MPGHDYISNDLANIGKQTSEMYEHFKKRAQHVRLKDLENIVPISGEYEASAATKKLGKHQQERLSCELKYYLETEIMDELERLIVNNSGVNLLDIQTLENKLGLLFDKNHFRDKILESQKQFFNYTGNNIEQAKYREWTGKSPTNFDIENVYQYPATESAYDAIKRMLHRFKEYLHQDQSALLCHLQSALDIYKKENLGLKSNNQRVIKFERLISAYKQYHEQNSNEFKPLMNVIFIKLMDYVGRVKTGEDYLYGYSIYNYWMGSNEHSLQTVLNKEFPSGSFAEKPKSESPRHTRLGV